VADRKKWKDIVRQALQPTVGCSANGRRRNMVGNVNQLLALLYALTLPEDGQKE